MGFGLRLSFGQLVAGGGGAALPTFSTPDVTGAPTGFTVDSDIAGSCWWKVSENSSESVAAVQAGGGDDSGSGYVIAGTNNFPMDLSAATPGTKYVHATNGATVWTSASFEITEDGVTDNFDQANGTILQDEAEYTGVGTNPSAFEARDGWAQFPDDATGYSGGILRTGEGFGANQKCRFKLGQLGVATVTNIEASGTVRTSSGTDGYRLKILFRSGSSTVVRLYVGGSSVAGDLVTNPHVDDEWEIEANGTTITCRRKPNGGAWGDIDSRTDATYSTGDPGIYVGKFGADTFDPTFEWATFGEV